MYGLAEIILAADDLPREPFPCPEWPAADGKLFVRVLTGTERLVWERAVSDFVKGTVIVAGNNPRALLAGKALVDEFGARVFNDEQAVALSEKSSAVLERAYDACLRISGIRETAAEVEAARKNSAKTPGAASSIA
jgi:hypothetical protein